MSGTPESASADEHAWTEFPREIVLPAEEFDQLMAHLDEPAVVNEKLVELFREHRRSIRMMD